MIKRDGVTSLIYLNLIAEVRLLVFFFFLGLEVKAPLGVFFTKTFRVQILHFHYNYQIINKNKIKYKSSNNFLNKKH